MALRCCIPRSADVRGRLPAARSPVGRSIFSRSHRSEREADAVAAVLRASGPAGEPLRDGALPAATRAWAEHGFGYDFSRVRVLADGEAASRARDLNARAFTAGTDIYLDRAALLPGDGPRLLAHELAHVVQQTTPAAHAVGAVQLHPVGATALQRDEKPAKEQDPVLAAIAEVEAASQEIAGQWKELRALARAGALEKLGAKGDKVVELLDDHVALAIAALRAGTSATELTTVIETDLAAYRFIAWHLVVGANLEGMRSDLDDLIDSFDADDRAFTGRAEVEKFNRELQELVKGFPKQVEAAASRVTTHRIALSIAGGKTQLLTVTNATTDTGELASFLTEALALEKTQAALQVGVEATWQFLDNATAEGLAQAVDIYLEFRGGGRGKRGGPKLESKGRPKKTKKTKKTEKKEKKEKKEEKEEKEEDKPETKGSGKHTCFGRSFVLQIPSALPEHKCPDEITRNRQDGPSVRASSQDAACLAAKHAFNAMLPRGCRPKHLQCVCTKR